MSTTLINIYDPENSHQSALFGEDERRFEREQSRKRKPKVALQQALPDGPCCARCHHWTKPQKVDGFGVCRVLVLVTGRWPGMTALPQKGTVIEVDEALGRTGLDWEFLETRRFFGAGDGEIPSCTSFEPNEMEEAA